MLPYHLHDLTSPQLAVPPDGILSRPLYTDEQVRVVWFGFGAGQELSEHTASTPTILHFLSGEAEVQLGADVHTAHAGTWIHMPAKLPHSVCAKTPVVMMLLLLKDGADAA
jgi:quercetin dioxygenase-like cupin family protein